MPDLIRHPEHIEITGFQLPSERRNMHFLTFYETVNPDSPFSKGGKGDFLELEIWILPFDLAQGGELVEPFVICDLVLGIFSIIGTTIYMTSITIFLIYSWDLPPRGQHTPVHKSVIPLKPMGGKIGVDFDLTESDRF
jgi:hypothetical protein